MRTEQSFQDRLRNEKFSKNIMAKREVVKANREGDGGRRVNTQVVATYKH